MSFADQSSPAVHATEERYRNIALLGAGGMGDVYLALSRGIGGFVKLVVVKRLRSSLAQDPELLRMFLQEARLAARLNHPNIVQTNEVGRDQDGHYFIAMEYLEGQAYSRVLRRAASESKPLPLQLELHVLCQILEGLHHAHELRDFDGAALDLVHRDLSPQNVLLTYSGDCKLLDFGIAKGRASGVETKAGVFKGKVSFVAPEQVRGEEVDRRTDLFAAGAMLWRAAAGAPLWSGTPAVKILEALATGSIPQLLSVRPDAPAELARITRRALAPRKEERYATALEMKREIESFMSNCGLEVTRAELAELVTCLFAAEREEVRRLTQDRLRELEAESQTWETRLSSSGDRGSTLRPAVLSERLRPRRPNHPRRALLAVGAIAGVALLGAALVFGRAVVSAQPAVSESATNLSDTVAVSITASPPDALIRVDGVPRPNPWTGRLARSDATILVSADRDGYLAKTRRVELNADVVLELELARAGSLPAAAAETSDAELPHGTARRARPNAGRSAPAASARAAAAPATNSSCTTRPWRTDGTGVKRLRPECESEVLARPATEDTCAYPWRFDERGVKRLRVECAHVLR